MVDGTPLAELVIERIGVGTEMAGEGIELGGFDGLDVLDSAIDGRR